MMRQKLIVIVMQMLRTRFLDRIVTDGIHHENPHGNRKHTSHRYRMPSARDDVSYRTYGNRKKVEIEIFVL